MNKTTIDGYVVGNPEYRNHLLIFTVAYNIPFQDLTQEFRIKVKCYGELADKNHNRIRDKRGIKIKGTFNNDGYNTNFIANNICFRPL